MYGQVVVIKRALVSEPGSADDLGGSKLWCWVDVSFICRSGLAVIVCLSMEETHTGGRVLRRLQRYEKQKVNKMKVSETNKNFFLCRSLPLRSRFLFSFFFLLLQITSHPKQTKQNQTTFTTTSTYPYPLYLLLRTHIFSGRHILSFWSTPSSFSAFW